MNVYTRILKERLSRREMRISSRVHKVYEGVRRHYSAFHAKAAIAGAGVHSCGVEGDATTLNIVYVKLSIGNATLHGVNILRLNPSEKCRPPARNARESWKIIARDRRVRVSCSRRLRRINLNFLQHDILKREAPFDRAGGYTREYGDSGVCLTCHLHVDTRTFRPRDAVTGTRVAYTRADQTVENNDEAGCNACYYLHFLSRRDVRASIRARDATGTGHRTKEKAYPARCARRKKSRGATAFGVVRTFRIYLMMIQHANKLLMPTRVNERLVRIEEERRCAREPRSACGFIIIYAPSLRFLALRTPPTLDRPARAVYTHANIRPSEKRRETLSAQRQRASPRQERIGAFIFTGAFSMRIRHADASLTVFRMASDMRYPVRYFTPSRSRRVLTQCYTSCFSQSIIIL